MRLGKGQSDGWLNRFRLGFVGGYNDIIMWVHLICKDVAELKEVFTCDGIGLGEQGVACG